MAKIMRMIMVLLTILMTAGFSSCSNDDDEYTHTVKNAYEFDGEVVKVTFTSCMCRRAPCANYYFPSLF